MNKIVCPVCLKVLDHLEKGDKIGDCCVSYLESQTEKNGPRNEKEVD
jgi:hypothetical protein